MAEPAFHKINRALRIINDKIIDGIAPSILGQQVILYRYEGDRSATSLDDVNSFYREAGYGEDTRYSGPIETAVAILWPDDLVKLFNDSVDLSDHDTDPIEIPVRLKNEDYITVGSYFKTQYKIVDQDNIGTDVDTEASEQNLILRLEVVEIDSVPGASGEATIKGTATFKRDDTNLAPTDSSLTADVPTDYFDDV